MNFKMWVKALRVIPRITREEWDELDVISRWLIVTRAAVLIMTFISAAIAGLLAARDGYFIWWKWILLAVGLVFAHATNNILNDMTDTRRGVDKENYFRTMYGPQVLQQGLLTEQGLFRYAAVTGAIALAAGIVLLLTSGPLTIPLLLAGVVFVLFYTWPLKYIGLGEVAVLIVWGPLMIAGGYYVLSGVWSWPVVIASLPYAFGPVTVIFGKHIDKMKEDKAKGIHTLPVIIGETAGRYAVMAMIVLQYALVVYLVATGYFSWIMLFIFLGAYTLPRVLPVFLKPRPTERPAEYSAEIWPLWFVASAFYQNRGYGMVFILLLILQLIFFRAPMV